MNYTKKSPSLQDYNKMPRGEAHQRAVKAFESKELFSKRASGSSASDASLLVKTEVCFFSEANSQKQALPELPAYVRKFVRKHTAVYCMISDGSQRVENETLLKFATRLSCCNSKINDFIEPKSIDIKEQKHDNGKSRHVHGTIKCGSPWICPSCSATLSMTRGDQLKHMVECGRDHGRGYGMAVLTVRHKPGQTLLYLQEALTDIWRRVQQRVEFKRFKQDHKIRFQHRGYEIMGSIKNGLSDWHPHFNIVFDFDELPDMNEEEKIRFELETAKTLWSLCNKIAVKRWDISLQEPFLEEITRKIQGKNESFLKTVLQVKGGVSFNLDFVEEYTTKFGLVEEAMAGMYKDGRVSGSFHPFQILDMIRSEDPDLPKKDRLILIGMYREYAEATKGKSFFRFAPGSVKYYQDNYGLDLEILDDELEIQNREAQGEVFYKCELELWRLFKPNSMDIATLLQQNTSQGMEDYILQVINGRLKNPPY